MSASEAKPETFTRYIYVYRWKATGVPVYVGSAWNPNKRDKEHSRAPAIPFDRVITKHGRELFTLETVEAVQGETLTECWADSVPRENHWMDALKTWHEFGGQNFARATRYFDNEEQFKAWQAASAAAKKRRSQDPAWQATLRAAKARPEVKARHSASAHAMWTRPEYKERHNAALRAAYARPDVIARRSASVRSSHARPAVRARLSAVAQAREARPEVKARHSASMWAAHAEKRRARALGMLPYPVKFLRLYNPSL